jgi:hypothetical protein
LYWISKMHLRWANVVANFCAVKGNTLPSLFENAQDITESRNSCPRIDHAINFYNRLNILDYLNTVYCGLFRITVAALEKGQTEIKIPPARKQRVLQRNFVDIPAMFRIRICMDPHWFWSTGSGSRRAKWPKKVEKISNFEVLDVLFWAVKASFVAYTSLRLLWRPGDR